MSVAVLPRPHRTPARPFLAAVAHRSRNVAPLAASLLPGVVCRGTPRDDAGRPLLYVTIDDGPDAAGTPLILDVLARERARGTFFVLASNAARDVGLLRAIAEAGHGVGNHGRRHLDAWSERGAVNDLAEGQRWLEDTLGVEVLDVRPPYGHLVPATYRWARRSGKRVVLWDAMPGDFDPSTSPARLAALLARRVRPGSIAVLHDGRAANSAAGTLTQVLPRLRDAGWRFPSL